MLVHVPDQLPPETVKATPCGDLPQFLGISLWIGLRMLPKPRGRSSCFTHCPIVKHWSAAPATPYILRLDYFDFPQIRRSGVRLPCFGFGLRSFALRFSSDGVPVSYAQDCRGSAVHFPSLPAPGAFSRRAASAARISAGRGGHPEIRRSTGIWRSTGPVTA